VPQLTDAVTLHVAAYGATSCCFCHCCFLPWCRLLLLFLLLLPLLLLFCLCWLIVAAVDAAGWLFPIISLALTVAVTTDCFVANMAVGAKHCLLLLYCYIAIATAVFITASCCCCFLPLVYCFILGIIPLWLLILLTILLLIWPSLLLSALVAPYCLWHALPVTVTYWLLML